MNKHFSILVLLCIVGTINAHSHDTFYYKLTNIHNNKYSLKIQGGQFITFIGDICFESDKEGIGVGHGTLTYNPSYSSSTIKKYLGKSYWGDNAVFSFSSDKSILNVALENEMVLVYRRTTPPEGVYTCSLIKQQKSNSSSSSGSGGYNPPPVYTAPIYPSAQNSSSTTKESSTYSSPQKKWRTITYQEDCHMCHGLGKCWTCSGKGWEYNKLGVDGVHDCPNCSNGECSHCHGTGKVTKTKQVFE